MFKFLTEDSNISTTRVVLFTGAMSALLLIMAMTTYILIHAIKCTAIDWSGLAIFLTGISAYIGTLLYGKVTQKKYEMKTTKN